MGEDRTRPEPPPERHLTVSDAALELGLSAEAVRSRVKRGSLRSIKVGGTVYVLLEADQARPDSAQTTTERDRADDQTATERDQSGAQTPPEHGHPGARVDAQMELVDSLLDQVAYMREQLAEEREARRRADTIIAQLSQANAALAKRVPEIEAGGTPEARESPTRGADDETGGVVLDEDTGQPRPSWWRRFFFGE